MSKGRRVCAKGRAAKWEGDVVLVWVERRRFASASFDITKRALAGPELHCIQAPFTHQNTTFNNSTIVAILIVENNAQR